jgi:hypothetical protein
MKLRRILVVFPLTLALPACASRGDANGDTASGALSSSENTDVQVVSAASKSQLTWDVTTPRYDFLKCHYYDKVQAPPLRQGQIPEFTAEAKADCTDAVALAQERPPINGYFEPLAWIRENPNLDRVVMRHWCHELDVTVAVKAAAWDSPNFEGIGFYGHEPVINADQDKRRVFYAKDDPRLVRVGEGKLKNEGDAKVYLYRFGGAGPCAVNGSGQAPSSKVEFKPFVKFAGGEERWEAVKANHGLRFRESWDRRGDLLR